MKRFEAKGIVVLRFNRKADSSGEIYPPECHATFNPWVWVTFGASDDDEDKVIGKAKLRREGDELIADLEVESQWDHEEARKAIATLRPAICGKILDAHKFTILQVEIMSIALCAHNADRKILPLGDRLRPLADKGMH